MMVDTSHDDLDPSVHVPGMADEAEIQGARPGPPPEAQHLNLRADEDRGALHDVEVTQASMPGSGKGRAP